MSEPKVVIAGTGRAGTTLLVQILTQLGLDTGFATDAPLDTHARAGLELASLKGNAPRIVKNPALSTNLRGVLERGDVEIEHVIIPMRDLDVAAASRVRVSEYGRRPDAPGGIWHTNRGNQQRDALAGVFYELIWTLVEFDIPYTFLAFPKFALDADYLAEKLAWLAPDATIDDFRRVVANCTDPGLITQHALTTDELRQMRRGTIYATFVSIPLKHARRLFHTARTKATSRAHQSGR